MLLAGDKVDALSLIVHKDAAYDQGRALIERLRRRSRDELFDVQSGARWLERDRPGDGEGPA